MRCGICKSASPTFEYRGLYGRGPAVVQTVRDAGDLVTHKRQQHPEEYAKSIQARKDTKAAREAADLDYYRRRGEAGRAVGQKVLYCFPYGERVPAIRDTAGIGSYERLSDFRYPEPEAFAEYEALLAEGERIKKEADLALRFAFEHGAPVPQEDVDQVRAAMDAVSKEGGAS